MKTKTIIIDIDNTMIDSSTAVCDAYNELYKSHLQFREINITKNTREFPYLVASWFPLIDDKEWNYDLFESDIFFEIVKPFPGAVEVLRELNEDYGYNIIPCSAGTYKNIIQKCNYLPKVFPFIKEFIPIIGMKDKSIVDMSNCYFIDDYPPNLQFNCSCDWSKRFRFSHYTYTDTIKWDGKEIPDYESLRKIFIDKARGG